LNSRSACVFIRHESKRRVKRLLSPCDANAAAVALVFPDDVSAEAHVACSATQLQSLLSSSSSGASRHGDVGARSHVARL
jgi:hypothetical protein